MPKQRASYVAERASRLGELGSPTIPDELPGQVAILLGFDPIAHAGFVEELRQAAISYLEDQVYYDVWLTTAGEGRAATKHMVAVLSAAIAAVGCVPLEFIATIEGIAARAGENGAGQRSPVDDCRNTALCLRSAAEQFLVDYRPKRGAPGKLALEAAVRTLVPLIEAKLSLHPIGTDDDGDKLRTKLKSLVATAIAKLLGGVDSHVMRAGVLRMMNKVLSQPRVSEDLFSALFEADPGLALDCSLLARGSRR